MSIVIKEEEFVGRIKDGQNEIKGDRFVIVEGSYSGHCCFNYSILDMLKSKMRTVYVEGEQLPEYPDDCLENETVCECFELESAKLVCIAINLKEK